MFAGWQVTLPYGMRIPVAVRRLANYYTPFTLRLPLRYRGPITDAYLSPVDFSLEPFGAFLGPMSCSLL